ncbi:NAD(P)H-dependent oxidoreductase [Trinickia sp. NRRL B-1857]|uniref:NADPH-dependent FMN reductase n=1 Tax=Trinickia sp. NRRL B-1857 TaxID=3162879 RepID=UPI003D29E53E
MKALIVNGSHRQNSESARVARVLQDHFLPAHFTDIGLHDLGEMDLPFWDEGVWNGDPEWEFKLEKLRKDQYEADALIFVCPEWNGMATPRLKNYFLLGDEGGLEDKPALIVAVSAGLGGAYVVSELRSSSYKNTKLCYIPDHLIIRDVSNMLTTAPLFSDDPIADRCRYSVGRLAVYAQALSVVRVPLNEPRSYPYGM